MHITYFTKQNDFSLHMYKKEFTTFFCTKQKWNQSIRCPIDISYEECMEEDWLMGIGIYWQEHRIPATRGSQLVSRRDRRGAYQVPGVHHRDVITLGKPRARNRGMRI